MAARCQRVAVGRVEVDDHRRIVAGLFGRAAAGYDQVGFFHQVAQRLLALAGVAQGMRVVDVACGTGAVLVQAAGLVGPTGLAAGVDLAEPMIAVAAQRLQQEAMPRPRSRSWMPSGWRWARPASIRSAALRRSTCRW
jgi:ubiquinone/menaquinone biosynthesis C-methylase UbiE